MSEKEMLVIDHIEPTGLIAEDGATLGTAVFNHYVLPAVNQLVDQSEHDTCLMLGGVAGHALAQLFDRIDISDLDSVLDQLKHFVLLEQVK